MEYTSEAQLVIHTSDFSALTVQELLRDGESSGIFALLGLCFLDTPVKDVDGDWVFYYWISLKEFDTEEEANSALSVLCHR